MVLEGSNMDTKFEFVKAYRSIWIGVAITFGVSILFLIGTFASPRAILYLSLALGGLSYFFLSGLLIYSCTKYQFIYLR